MLKALSTELEITADQWSLTVHNSYTIHTPKSISLNHNDSQVFPHQKLKNHTHVKMVGHTSNFFLRFIDELEK